MNHRRFTLAGLLVAVVLSGILFAGLRSGSNDWFVCIYTATFIVLVYAAIAARYREAFWYGFAVAGWAYFLVGFGPWIGWGAGQRPAASHQRTVNRNLATSVVLEIVADALARGDAVSTTPSTPATFQASFQKMLLRKDNRNGIGHGGLTILFAFVSGLVSRGVARRSSSDRPS